jgi:hypothetical protein
MLAAVPEKITLSVTIEIEAARPGPSRDRMLPDRGVNQFALPFHITR